MSTQKIPNSLKQIIQSNDGDYKGNLWATFNIDLDSNPGTIKTSRKLKRSVDNSINIWSAGSIFQAVVLHDGFYYAINNDDAIRCSVTNDPTVQANWSAVAGIWGFGTLYSDMTSFKGLLLTSTSTNIASYDGATLDNGWWTTIASGTALTASKPHILEVLRTGADSLFITDGNKIRYYNTAAAGTIITLDTLMTANCLTSGVDRMWVGTYTEVENNAWVYEVQVGNTATTQAYEIDGRVCLTMFTHNNTPFVITERGYIQAFNGVGFQTIAQFPWANESKVMEGCRPGNVQDPNTSRAIHPKGAKVKGKYCYINVNADDEFITNDYLLSPRGASGVWVLDLETYSLTHRYAMADDVSPYGSSYVSNSGPILVTNTPDTRLIVASFVNGKEGLWMESDNVNQGYFIATRHEADSVADSFEALVIKTDTLDTGEEVIAKYKDESRPNFPLTITDISWLDSTRFTTTNALTGVLEATEDIDGDEVEIISGVGAGQMAHIVTIEGGTTKTVTLDASMGTVLNNLSDIRIESFKKIATNEERSGEYEKLGSAKGVSPSRQYKVVMKGNVVLREFISKSNSKEEL